MTSTTIQSGDGVSAPQRALRVLLYSDDVDTRTQVRLAIGTRPAADLPVVEWTECATAAAVIAQVDAGGLDLLVLDGEATPVGGLGLCKQLRDEFRPGRPVTGAPGASSRHVASGEFPPVLVLTGRAQDAWLATWSGADLAVAAPLDPLVLAQSLATLARRRLEQ